MVSIRNEKMLLIEKAKELELKLMSVQEQENKIKMEIVDVDAQIDYYHHLTKDIKKDVHPPKLHGLLKDMGKG